MRGIGANLLLVAAFVVIAWAILEAMGFEMALVTSLGLSIALTLLINLVMVAIRRGRSHRTTHTTHPTHGHTY